MKALSPAGVTAAVIVALIGLPALATTAPSSDSKGMERASPAENTNANVTTGQKFQDQHDNASDPNTTVNKKVAKAKKKKAKRVAQSDTTRTTTPQ